MGALDENDEDQDEEMGLRSPKQRRVNMSAVNRIAKRLIKLQTPGTKFVTGTLPTLSVA